MAKKGAIHLELDTTEWSKAVKKFVQESRRKHGSHEKAGRALFFELMTKVILKTPVDTGRARGGWGATPGVKIPRANPKPPKKDTTAEGKALSKYSEQHSGGTVTLAVTNNVDYVQYLEKGTSAQAPFGMVTISERELLRDISGIQLPPVIAAAYETVWEATGAGKGTEIRAGAKSDLIKFAGDLRGEVIVGGE